MTNMDWEAVIGLEIHVQLRTQTKLFCRCSAQIWNELPNSHVCPVCLGLPGALPVLNREAINQAIRAGLALESQVQMTSLFERKHYFYPDLPKGYQISQYQKPLCIGGQVRVEGQVVNLERAHLEEDTGKLFHKSGKEENFSLIDFNRSGIPLLEVVSKPVIDTPTLAVSYAQKVQQLMRYAGASVADMEKGSLRVDANISLRRKGNSSLGVKVEVKNMNSFRSLERALKYEIERQGVLLSLGEAVRMETRGWVETQGKTVPQRSKEEAHDYHYFPDPDLPPLEISPKAIERLQKELPEMPEKKATRYQKEYCLDKAKAQIVTKEKEVANWFEESLRAYAQTEERGTRPSHIDPHKAVEVYNWVVNELSRLLTLKGKRLTQTPILPAHLAEILYLRDKGEITTTSAKKVFEKAFETGESAQGIVKSLGLEAKQDLEFINQLSFEVIKRNPKAALDYKSGKKQALKFLIGEVMRQSKGAIDPSLVEKALKRNLTLS